MVKKYIMNLVKGETKWYDKSEHWEKLIKGVLYNSFFTTLTS